MSQDTDQLQMQKDLQEPLPPLHIPAGYTFRVVQDPVAADYATVIDAAFPGDHHDFQKEVTSLPSYFPGATTIVYYDNHPVATATALCKRSGDPFAGYLHMVGVLPQHRGRRLGEKVSLQALQIMQNQGMRSCALETDDFRLAAILSYLRLGFLPKVASSSQHHRWQQVLKQLSWPLDIIDQTPSPEKTEVHHENP